eukprot:310740-Rhodomonas_salina.1
MTENDVGTGHGEQHVERPEELGYAQILRWPHLCPPLVRWIAGLLTQCLASCAAGMNGTYSAEEREELANFLGLDSNTPEEQANATSNATAAEASNSSSAAVAPVRSSAGKEGRLQREWVEGLLKTIGKLKSRGLRVRVQRQSGRHRDTQAQTHTHSDTQRHRHRHNHTDTERATERGRERFASG